MKKTLCFAAFSAGALLAGGGIAAAQESSPAPDQPPAQPHTVAVGESLTQISEAVLGTSDRWVEIFALNRATVASPDMIEVGQVLAIPTAPVAIPADLLASLAPAPAPSPVLRRQSGATAPRAAPSTQVLGSGSGSGGGGGDLAAIRACESGGNYGAVSPSGQYRGAYQFDLQTWQSVGGNGDPAEAPAAEQDARADQLRSQRGSNPWPSCG